MGVKWQRYRLIGKLPVVVRFGAFRWRVSLEYYGKGATRAEFAAHCLDDARKADFGLNGREGWVTQAIRTGFQVRQGTMAFEIAECLVRDGCAARIVPDRRFPE